MTPNHGERSGRGSNGGVVAPRKSDPVNGGATPYQHYGGKWLCRRLRCCGDTYFRWRDGENSRGMTAPITAAHVQPQYGTFTLPKRCNATSSPKETETNEAVSSDGRQEPARSTAFAEGLTATAALYQTFGQSLGCRREADRSEAHTAVDLMAAPAMCSDFTRMPRQRTDRQPSRLKV